MIMSAISSTLRFMTASALGLMLLPAVAQEEDAASDPSTSMLPRVVYIDVPVPLIDGVDPVFPPVPAMPVATDASPSQEQAESIRRYTEAIAGIEAQGGVWDISLTEELTAMGSLLQQQGNHLAALETFDRAMHVNRINSGLHTTDQVAIVNEIIESYMVLGNWGQVDLYHNYLFYIQQKAYGPEDPRIIPVLAELGRWNLRAFSMGFGEILGLRLSTAQIMFNAAARMVGLHFGRDDERFIPYLHNVARSAYQVALNPQLMTEMDRPDYLKVQDMLRTQLNERTPVVPQGYRDGEAALLEILAFYGEENQDPYLLAEATANLGDWYMIFQQRRNGHELYRRAWELLAEQDDGAALQQRLFGQLQPIPTYTQLPRLVNRRGAETPARAQLTMDFVDLSFEVSRNGEVRDVAILNEETSANAGHFGRVARELRRTVFRPLLVDGEPVQSSDHRVRIRYWY